MSTTRNEGRRMVSLDSYQSDTDATDVARSSMIDPHVCSNYTII
jgi:hypothetical protein